MKQNPVDRCSNILCSNRAEAGRFTILTIGVRSDQRPVAIPMCNPCAGSVQRTMELVAEKMYEDRGPSPTF